MTPTWRLILDETPRTGAANMAIDQAIAEATSTGAVPPTLRFYRWAPPAISLGRHQPIADIDLAAARERGYDVVRRTTGGRAILHTDELTYSVAGAESEPILGGGVMESYLRLSNALVLGLQRAGLPEVGKADGGVRAGPNVSAACFEVPSAYEILWQGKKLLGSAQSRRGGHVLQHGSLPLVGDITRLIDVLDLDDLTRQELATDLATRATTLATALGVADDDPAVDFARLTGIFAAAFEEQLGIGLSPKPLTPDEIRRSAELIRTQFASDGWTHRRELVAA